MNVKRRELSRKIRDYIKFKEKDLGYRCLRLWYDTDYKYLYGKFKDGSKEGLIVTIAYREDRIPGRHMVPFNFAGGG